MYGPNSVEIHINSSSIKENFKAHDKFTFTRNFFLFIACMALTDPDQLNMMNQFKNDK